MTTIEWDGMTGIFKGNVESGIFTTDKCKLTGRWVNDAFTGKGTWVYPNNDKYEGGFVLNMRHGKGKYTLADGSVYDGDFNYGNMTGFGVFTNATDGSVYEGGWKNNKKHGRGKTTYKNGIVFGSEYKHGENEFLKFLGHMFGWLDCLKKKKN